MTGVLRIALAYFRILPLQRQLNGAGLLLFAIALALAVFGSSRGTASGAVVGSIFGAMLIVLAPGFVGGGAMRAASSPLVLHLRPGSRVRMVLGATLAITLLAAIATLPVVIGQYTQQLMAPRNRPFTASPLEILAMCWAALAMVWMVTFMLSRSVWVVFLVGLLPLAMIKAGMLLAAWLPGPFFTAGLVFAAWLGFSLWYVRARSIRRGALNGIAARRSMEFTPFLRLQTMLETRGNLSMRERALRQLLLGTTSPWTFAVGGVWIVVVLLAMQLLNTQKGPQNLALSISMMPAVALMTGAFGYSTVRRARYLWLRLDASRQTLFEVCERRLLICTPAMLLVAGGALMFLSAQNMRDIVLRMPLFAAALVLLSLCGLYSGMGNTRGFRLADLLITIVLLVIGLAEAAWLMRAPTLQPSLVLAALGIPLLLVALLRSRARRNWMELDWRVAQVPTFGRAA